MNTFVLTTHVLKIGRSQPHVLIAIIPVSSLILLNSKLINFFVKMGLRDLEKLKELQKDVKQIRNICILAHVDHGKVRKQKNEISTGCEI